METERVGCKAGTFPFTVLGLPIGGKTRSADFWQPLISEFNSKLSAWKSGSLSYGGRFVLSKSVLGNVGLHRFSLFKAPISVLKKIRVIEMFFFLGYKNGLRKIDWVKWNEVPAAKEDCGLGIGSLRAQNLALLSRWWWRFSVQSNALWKHVIIAIHGNDGGFGSLANACRFPRVWTSIVKIYKDFHKLDLPIEQWFQQWHGVEELEDQRAEVVHQPHTFKLATVRIKFDEAYLQSNFQRATWWVNWVPTKLNIFGWRVMKKRIPSKVNLSKRGVVCLSMLCPLCEEMVEGDDHLFISCPISNHVLREVLQRVGLQCGRLMTIDDLIWVVANVNLKTNQKKGLVGIIFVYFWLIWRKRNGKEFSSTGCHDSRFKYGEVQALKFFWFRSRAKSCNLDNRWSDWCSRPLECL